MTNNDELAIKPVGNLFISDKCEVVFSPSKRPIAGFQFAGSVYSAEQVNALLAERDADKKRIAELTHNHRVHAARLIDERGQLKGRIAEMEARTVSVKIKPATIGVELTVRLRMCGQFKRCVKPALPLASNWKWGSNHEINHRAEKIHSGFAVRQNTIAQLQRQNCQSAGEDWPG